MEASLSLGSLCFSSFLSVNLELGANPLKRFFGAIAVNSFISWFSHPLETAVLWSSHEEHYKGNSLGNLKSFLYPGSVKVANLLLGFLFVVADISSTFHRTIFSPRIFPGSPEANRFSIIKGGAEGNLPSHSTRSCAGLKNVQEFKSWFHSK